MSSQEQARVLAERLMRFCTWSGWYGTASEPDCYPDQSVVPIDERLTVVKILTAALAQVTPPWTKDVPTIDGYYWLKTMLMNDAGFERGSIMVRVAGKNGVIEHGGQFSSFTLDSMDGQWSGPLSPPEETAL